MRRRGAPLSPIRWGPRIAAARSKGRPATARAARGRQQGRDDGTIDPNLASALAALGPDEAIEAIVYPGPSGLTPLGAHLKELQGRGALQFNLLTLAGCAAVRAPKGVLTTLAASPLVARMVGNARFSAG